MIDIFSYIKDWALFLYQINNMYMALIQNDTRDDPKVLIFTF